MYRPKKIIDSHIHLVTAGTHRVKLASMAQLDHSLVKAYHERWDESLTARREQGPESDPAEVETVARKWSAQLDAADIERAVFFTSNETPEEIIRFISLNPERFTGYTTFDPTLKEKASLLKTQIEQSGIKGVKLYPMARHFHVDDPDCFPVYEVCQENDIPVIIHFGLSINATHNLAYGNPMDLATPALRFPSLRWIVPHFGTGFFRELLLLAAQYKNIYIDTCSSNNWVQYSPYPLTLKDLFMRSFDTVGAKRILFGTDSSFFPRGYRTNILEEQLAVCNELNMSREDMDRIFYHNIKAIIDNSPAQ